MTSGIYDLTDWRVVALFMRCLSLLLQYHDGADYYDYEKSWCGARQCIRVSRTLVGPPGRGDSIPEGGAPRVLPCELGWGRSYTLMVGLWRGFLNHIHMHHRYQHCCLYLSVVWDAVGFACLIENGPSGKSGAR